MLYGQGQDASVLPHTPQTALEPPFSRLVQLAATVLNCRAAFLAVLENGEFRVRGCLNVDPKQTAAAQLVCEEVARTKMHTVRLANPISLCDGSTATFIAAAPLVLDQGRTAVICVLDVQGRPDLTQEKFRYFFEIAAIIPEFTQHPEQKPASRQSDEQVNLRLLDEVRRAQSLFIDGKPSDQVFSILVHALSAATGSSHAFLGALRRDDQRLQTLGISASADQMEGGLHAAAGASLTEAIQTALQTGSPAWVTPAIWNEPGNAGSCCVAVNHLLVLPCYNQSSPVGIIAIAGAAQGYRADLPEQLRPFLLSFASLVEAAQSRSVGRQASEALRLRDRSLSSISSAVAIADMQSPHKPIIYCNKAFETITGYPAEQVIGRDFQLLEGPEPDSKLMPMMRSAFEEGQDCEMTVRTYRRDGSWFWNHLRLSPVRETSGAIRHIVAIADDVTEKLRYQGQLVESEARKSAILRSSLDCILTVDLAGLILDSNPAAESTLGYQRGETINQHLRELIVPLSAGRLAAHEIRTGERFEITAVRSNGNTFPAELAVTAMIEKGEPIYTAHIRDLTEWKKSLREQRETVAFQRAILDGANYIIIATDVDGTVRTFNDAASRMLGYSQEEILGRHNLTLFHDPTELDERSHRLAVKFKEPVTAGFETCVVAARHQQSDPNDWTYVRKNGTRFPVQLSITALKNDLGEVSGFLAIGYDITEQRSAQEEQQKFVALVENSDDFIGMSTLDGRAFYVNQAGRSLAGLDSSEQVSRTRIPNFVTKDTWAVVRDVAMPALRTTGKWEGEGQLRNFKTGKPVDVLLTLFVVRDGTTGKPLCLATVQRDITERKRWERALLQEKEFSDTLIRSSVDGIFAFDHTLRVTAWNPAMEQFAGMLRDDVIGQEVFELFPFLGNDPRLLGVLDGSSGIIKDRPYSMPQTGRRGYFEAHCSPLRDALGEIMGGLAVVRDTTERRRAEESVRRSEKRYRTVVESIKEVIFHLGSAGTWAFLNPAWQEITGFEVEQTLGHPWTDYLHPEDRQVAARLLDSLVKAEVESFRRELRIVTRSKAVKRIEIFAQATSDESGVINGVSGSLTDVTERKKTEEEMLRAKDAAEAAVKLKSEFLANMSHEIRTPINAVIGMTSILIDSPLSLEQRDYVNVIRSGGTALLSIIDEILDLSKIESGRMQLECAPFDLRDAIEGALDLVAARASEKNLELAYLVNPLTPATITGDVGRLRQILVNLLSNAVKFTEKGNVLISVSSTAIEGARQRIQFSVKDTGIGIAANKLLHIFESFSQVDASTTRRYGGTGLGLTISKRLCEMAGGEMWVESTPGVGSTFHFTMLADAVDAESPRDRGSYHSTLHGRTVLVVEQDGANQLVLRQHLGTWGMKPEVFANIADAQAWTSAGNKFDLVILDAERTDVTSAICEAFRERAPLVLLHSVGRRKHGGIKESGKRQLTFHAKPIKPSLLYESLLSLFAEEPIRVAGQPVAPAGEILAERIPARILLAEDNVVNQKVAGLLLAKLGYRVDVANNGIEAVEALRRQPYDVVLMDMQMPEMDGLVATQQILKDLGSEQPPWIIAMTANAMRSDRERCLAAGMRDFLSKPVQLADLRNAFERFGASIAVPNSEPPAPELPVWELPDYLEEMIESGDGALLNELLDLFLVEGREKLQLLRVALLNNDTVTGANLLHGLKGGAGQVGAMRFANLNSELETVLRAPAASLASVTYEWMFTVLSEEFERLERALSEHSNRQPSRWLPKTIPA